jgi:hypothetical protein
VTRTLRALTCALFCCGIAGEAHAQDWLITPFAGRTISGATALNDPEDGASAQHWLVGASGAWLSDGVLGFEGDVSHAPRFFERGRSNIVTGSHLTTLTGSVILAVPLAVTRESLRPYVVAGVGLLDARIDDTLGLSSVNSHLLGLNLGGGAMGFLSRRTGVRFDLRRLRSIRGEGETPNGTGQARLSYWRASVGVILRY